MDLQLSKKWQERVWSRECVIYCFQRWVCNAQITLSEDVIIQCGLLYNLTVSSTLTFVFWILFENPRFHSQSCAVPSVNLPVQWRDRRHEIMRALTNIFQLERDVYFVFFCATQIPVMNLLSTKQIQSVNGQHLTTSCFFFFISLNLHSLSLSPSLLKANQTNRWPSSNSGPWAAADASGTDGSRQLRWHVARNHSKCTWREMEARKVGKWWKFGLPPPAGTENYFLRCRKYKLLGSLWSLWCVQVHVFGWGDATVYLQPPSQLVQVSDTNLLKLPYTTRTSLSHIKSMVFWGFCLHRINHRWIC